MYVIKLYKIAKRNVKYATENFEIPFKHTKNSKAVIKIIIVIDFHRYVFDAWKLHNVIQNVVLNKHVIFKLIHANAIHMPSLIVPNRHVVHEKILLKYEYCLKIPGSSQK